MGDRRKNQTEADAEPPYWEERLAIKAMAEHNEGVELTREQWIAAAYLRFLKNVQPGPIRTADNSAEAENHFEDIRIARTDDEQRAYHAGFAEAIEVAAKTVSDLGDLSTVDAIVADFIAAAIRALAPPPG